MEEEPTYGRGQASGPLPEDQLLPEDEPQSRRKEEKKDEEVTLKSEPAAVELRKNQVNKMQVIESLMLCVKSCKEAGMSFHLTLRILLDQSVWLMSLGGSSRNIRNIRDLFYLNPGNSHSSECSLGKSWSTCTSEVKKTSRSISVPRPIHVSHNYLVGA